MALTLTVFAIFFLVIQVQIGHVASESQEVIFEVMDGELNQVLFIGEKDITMICHVSNTLHADVTIITPEGFNVATNDAVGNCVEHTISEITEQSDGNYSCRARYKDANTGQIVKKSKSLSLNVRNISRSVCFRNGSVPTEEYTEGDTLLLSCYCINDLGCFWTQTVVGSELGDRVQPNYTYQHNNKILLQIVVGPLNSTSAVSLRYDCVHGSQSDERCSIGPANASIKDFVLQHIPVSDHAGGCPTMVTPITGIIPEAMSFTSDKMKVSDSTTGKKVKLTAQYNHGADRMDDYILFILIIVAGLMLFVVALLLLFLLIPKNKGRKTDQDNDKGAQEKQVSSSQDHKEDIYAEPRKKHLNGDYPAKAIKVEAHDAGDEGGEFCIPEVSEYGIPMALRRDAIAEKDRVDEGEVFCVPDVSDYGIPMALRRDAIAEKDRVDEGELFCTPDVSEYEIPMALRRNGFGS